MNILAIIPARIGSKSIPKKNIKKLGGKPLIAYPIELAKSISDINKIVVSTDSKEIAKVAKKYGAEIPFIRTSKLAKDETPILPVLQHCIEYLEKNNNYKADLILLLYPTCPFLKKETVFKALNILKKGKCNSVMSVEEDYGRFWSYDKVKKNYKPFYPMNYVNRQYYDPLLKENGAIYFSKYEALMEKKRTKMEENRIVDYKSTQVITMDPNEVIDIDTPFDWKNAEKKIKKK
jgi:CMP-N,N'-diacetyllegionaminic acid synthase